MQTRVWAAALILIAFVLVFMDEANVTASRQRGRSPALQGGALQVDTRGRKVRRIRTVVPSGGRVDWGVANNLVAFDKMGSDGYYDLFIMRPDGSGVRCLTCNASGIAQQHNGNPAWHPSGRYIVFQSENPSQRGRRPLLAKRLMRVAEPGSGFRNNLWLTGPQGANFVQLTEVGGQGAVLHPHFSLDGSKLTWSERLGSGGGVMGEWAIMVADFVTERGRPKLANIRKYQPGEKRRFYETHGFFPDGRSVIISGNPEPSQGDYGFDIYRFDINTERLTNLTGTPREWDEHALISPDGSKIIWMSSRDIAGSSLSLTGVKTDYWMMNVDGSNKVRLTYFNDPTAPEYLKTNLLVAADSAWGPDGKQFLAYVKTDRSTAAGPVFLIDIE
jgi:Tol biopolymer transport system component